MKRAVSTDAWNQSRARLGEFLFEDQDYIFALNRHYALVVRIRATLEDPEELKQKRQAGQDYEGAGRRGR